MLTQQEFYKSFEPLLMPLRQQSASSRSHATFPYVANAPPPTPAPKLPADSLSFNEILARAEPINAKRYDADMYASYIAIGGFLVLLGHLGMIWTMVWMAYRQRRRYGGIGGHLDGIGVGVSGSNVVDTAATPYPLDFEKQPDLDDKAIATTEGFLLEDGPKNSEDKTRVSEKSEGGGQPEKTTEGPGGRGGEGGPPKTSASDLNVAGGGGGRGGGSDVNKTANPPTTPPVSSPNPTDNKKITAGQKKSKDGCDNKKKNPNNTTKSGGDHRQNHKNDQKSHNKAAGGRGATPSYVNEDSTQNEDDRNEPKKPPPASNQHRRQRAKFEKFRF